MATADQVLEKLNRLFLGLGPFEKAGDIRERGLEIIQEYSLGESPVPDKSSIPSLFSLPECKYHKGHVHTKELPCRCCVAGIPADGYLPPEPHPIIKELSEWRDRKYGQMDMDLMWEDLEEILSKYLPKRGEKHG